MIYGYGRVSTKGQGEKEMKKVLTGFRIAYVFDIADTDGSDEFLPVLVTGLAGNGEQEKEIYERLLAFISKEHTVREVSGTASKGSFNLETKIISVREDLDYLQKIKTLLHEYAHLLDFSMHPEDDISRNRRELIAESVAFVVSLRLGLDTSRYSMSYIKLWLKDKEGKIGSSQEEIDEVVNRIGNLVLLPPGINSKAGQKTFTEKKEVYKSYHLLMLNKIIDLNDWNKSTIENREIELLGFIEEMWG